MRVTGSPNGLQYDIVTQGVTVDVAQEALARAIEAETNYLQSRGKSLADVPAAPDRYWESYEEAEEVESLGEKNHCLQNWPTGSFRFSCGRLFPDPTFKEPRALYLKR